MVFEKNPSQRHRWWTQLEGVQSIAYIDSWRNPMRLQSRQIMWLVVSREPAADKAYWPGRVGLAVVDAALWPLMWIVLVLRAGVPTGVVGPAAISLCVLIALTRVHQALFANHRYGFSTWRWGKLASLLLLVGFVMKILMIRG